MSKPIYVLASPVRSKSDVEEIRALFAAPGRVVYACEASAHTPGQVLYGDVVVIGETAAPTVERDATGEVTRYASMSAARRACEGKQPAIETAPKADEYGVEHHDPEPEPEPEPEPDPLDEMDRMALIKMGAEKWPRQRSWATLGDNALRAAIRELEAGD